jgi:hypothetical protein
MTDIKPMTKSDRGVLAARLLQALHSQPGQHVSIGYETHRMLLHPRIEPIRAVVQKENEDSEDITILAVIIPREETITYLQNEYGLINGLRGSLERKP